MKKNLNSLYVIFLFGKDQGKPKYLLKRNHV